MSPTTLFPKNATPRNVITQRVLEHSRVTYEVQDDALVIAVKDQLLVRSAALEAVVELQKGLKEVAHPAGRLSERADVASADDVEIWQLQSPAADSIDTARRLRELVPTKFMATSQGQPPAVSPNHVCVVSPRYDTCPASPPTPAPAQDGFLQDVTGEPSCHVVVIDTGYVETNPPQEALDQRVTSVLGEWFDTTAAPPAWQASSPDLLDADGDHELDGIAGHGTFIAGLIAHLCGEAAITVVGQRHDALPLNGDGPGDRAMLFSTEYDVANALLANVDAGVDVVACGFAFPTLSGHASIPFTSAINVLTGPAAPRPGLAIVAPAGNEESSAPYWPAAHPKVFGVAATDRTDQQRATFSNWGQWADCCTRGEGVQSTFIDWRGLVQGGPAGQPESFNGWALWDGTSFAAPKVAAAIAKLVGDSGRTLLPTDAFQRLIDGKGGVPVSSLTDATVVPGGVTLPHLDLG